MVLMMERKRVRPLFTAYCFVQSIHFKYREAMWKRYSIYPTH